MNLFQNKLVLLCSLLLYTLFLTATLLYIRFPAEEFKYCCQTKMELLFPEAAVPLMT